MGNSLAVLFHTPFVFPLWGEIRWTTLACQLPFAFLPPHFGSLILDDIDFCFSSFVLHLDGSYIEEADSTLEKVISFPFWLEVLFGLLGCRKGIRSTFSFMKLYNKYISKKHSSCTIVFTFLIYSSRLLSAEAERWRWTMGGKKSRYTHLVNKFRHLCPDKLSMYMVSGDCCIWHSDRLDGQGDSYSALYVIRIISMGFKFNIQALAGTYR